MLTFIHILLTSLLFFFIYLFSVPFMRLLNPLDYEINVSEARKQAIIDLSTRVPVRTLPRQYTWDQIAKKRSNAAALESTGLQARSQFIRSYGSRAKLVKKCVCDSF